MNQDQLDILVVNTQSMLGLQGWELVQYLQSGDFSNISYLSRHLAGHVLMQSLKDYKMVDEVLTDQEIFNVQQKIDLLMLQDKNVWDNAMPLRFGFS